MQIISDIENFDADWKNCVMTLGDFDGLHKGHRYLLKKTVAEAIKNHMPAVLVTYDPSPKKVLQKMKHDSNIYTSDEKIILLQEFKLRAAVLLPFNKKMSEMPASDFLKKILLNKLHAGHIVLGYDHKFGRNRHGNFKYLKMASERYNFKVERISPIQWRGRPVSSTRIRNLLSSGKIKEANRLLGAPYLIMGPVIRGKERGRTLGIPTANLLIAPDKLIPAQGVYFGSAQYGAKKYRCVINIGNNPTFENVQLSVEAHLDGFNEEIYGQLLKIYFLGRLRDEKKFSGHDTLIKQIKEDIRKMRNQKYTVNYEKNT